MKKTKTVAVLFSSGLDSTYLVWKNLKDGNKVLPFYIEIKNNINKSKIEKQNITLLFEKFRTEFGSLIATPELLVSLDVFRAWNGLKFQQVPIWLFALNYVRDSDVDEIQIGYVSNDDAISYTDEIVKTYENQRWFFNNEKLRAKLTFPLVKEKKEQMLKELRSTDYIKHVFSCENPQIVDEKYIKTEELYGWKKDFLGDHFVKYENCGSCVPCQKILQNEELRHLYIDHVNADFKRLYLKNLETEYLYHFGDKSKDELKEVTFVEKDTDMKEVVSKGLDDLKAINKMVEKEAQITGRDVEGESIHYSKSKGAVKKELKKKPWNIRTEKDSDAEYDKKNWGVESTTEVNTEIVNDRPDYKVTVIDNT